MPKPPEKPVTFTPYDQIKPLTAPGYERLVNAGIGMGMTALEKDTDITALLAGYPGTGKTSYVQTLAHHLPDFSYLYIDGISLMESENINELRRELLSVRSYLDKAPLVIVFDELDFIAANRDIRPIEYGMSTGLIMNILNRRPEKTLIFAISNYPNNLDTAATNRIQYTLFFDLPDVQAMGKVLEEHGIPKPYEAAGVLDHQVRETDGRVVLRSLVRSCAQVSERSDDPEAMAALLFPHASQFDIHQVQDYELKNSGYRKRGERVLEYWERVAKEFADKGMVELL